jgi:CBS domain-containing protein
MTETRHIFDNKPRRSDMQVQDIMTSDVATARPDTNLAAISKLMWDRDCGFVPVVDAAGKVSGAITDRDICIASATRRLLPEQITAAQAMRRAPIHTSQPEDTVEKALATMKQFQVRRLPVIAADGTLRGVISMNDVVLASQRKEGPASAEIVSTLAAICAHPPTKAAAA